MSTWAVIKTGGKQYKVTEGQTIVVEKIEPTKDNQVVFDQVLLVKKDNQIHLGKPTVKEAKVFAKLQETFRDKKIRVVKFKPKSRYLRTRGHRQLQSRIIIQKISA